MANEQNMNSAEVQPAVENTPTATKKKNKKKKVLIVLLIIVAVIVISAIATSGSKEYDYSKPEAIVTVDTLLNDFKENASSASEKYSDKVIAVTGKIHSIDEKKVVLEAYDDANWLYYVYADFESKDALKELKTKSTVTIVGVCDDTTLFGDVDINSCVVDKSFETSPDYAKAEKTSIDELVKAYKDNPVSADESYKGKTIEVTGKVSYISDDYIIIEPKDAELFNLDCDVQVYFENDDDIKSVKENKKITVVGECYGKGDIYIAKLCRAIVK